MKFSKIRNVKSPNRANDIDAGIGVWVDPVTEARRASNFTNTFGFNGNTLISYNIMNGLTGSIRIGARVDEGKTKNYYTKEKYLY